MSEISEAIQAKCLAFGDRIIKLNDYLLEQASKREEVRSKREDGRRKMEEGRRPVVYCCKLMMFYRSPTAFKNLQLTTLNHQLSRPSIHQKNKQIFVIVSFFL